ncbi:MAG: ABC transporter permease [Pseudolysinimonas sp.]|uniref:ABC transporter permease n=1 Tax=Pseudolysinimonas sp. TaxID=2680009 RepID=UPI003267A029
MEDWIPTAIALVVLVAIGTAALTLGRIRSPWMFAAAMARAVVQLAALSLVLTGIIQSPLWVGVGLGVMFIAAVGTAAGRSRAGWRGLPRLAAAMVAGPLLVGVIAFGFGAIEFSPRYVLALGGIVIGNTMTIAVLSGRVFRGTVLDHWDEVEGWLALGATPRVSTALLARQAIATSLLPSVDQTRTTGIVVLPGAFIGAVFAGASPLEAGRFQLIVLAAILAAGAITATLLVAVFTTVTQRPRAL